GPCIAFCLTCGARSPWRAYRRVSNCVEHSPAVGECLCGFCLYSVGVVWIGPDTACAPYGDTCGVYAVVPPMAHEVYRLFPRVFPGLRLIDLHRLDRQYQTVRKWHPTGDFPDWMLESSGFLSACSFHLYLRKAGCQHDLADHLLDDIEIPLPVPLEQYVH